MRRTGNEHDRPGARQLPVAGRCAARRKLRRGRRGGPHRQVRRQPAGARSTRISPARSPPPSSAIRPAWRGTPRRRCRCCRPPRASTRPPWPACCAGWPWPGRPAPPTATSAATLLSELDEVTRWLAARAADAPENFLHLLRLLEAERAWAVGDFRAAALAFDAARREAAGRQRPVAPGPDHRTRGPLLPRPRPRPRRLRPARPGPPGVRRLGRDRQGRPARLGLPDPATATRRDRRRTAATSPLIRAGSASAVTTGTIDLLGILSASQALSSETSIDRLHARVVEVLGAMTGATGVHLLLWSDDRHDWLLPAPGRRHHPGQRHRPRARGADVGAALRPAHARAAGRGRRHRRRPVRPRPVLRRPRLLLAAGRAHPQPRHAAGGAAAGEPAASAARSPPTGSTRSSSSPASSPSRWTTPSCTPSSPRRARGSSPPPTRPAAGSSATCTTAPSSGWSRWPCACARRRRRCRPRDQLAAQLDRAGDEATSALDELRELARGIHPVILAEGGLAPALDALARRSPIPVELHVAVEGRLPEQVEISRLLRRRRGADQRGQARRRLARPRRGRTIQGERTDDLRVRSATTARRGHLDRRHRAARPQRPRRGTRRPDLSSTAHPKREPPCASNSPSPAPTATPSGPFGIDGRAGL